MPKNYAEKTTPVKKIKEQVLKEEKDKEKKRKDMLDDVTAITKTSPSQTKKIPTTGVVTPKKPRSLLPLLPTEESIHRTASKPLKDDCFHDAKDPIRFPTSNSITTVSTKPALSSSNPQKEEVAETDSSQPDLTDAERSELRDYSEHFQVPIEEANFQDLLSEVRTTPEQTPKTVFFLPKNKETSFKNRQTGYLGEAIAYKALVDTFKGKNYQINWKNREKEAGEPFDIEVTTPDGKKIYYEVKSTTQPQRKIYQPCYFTMRETQFMRSCYEQGKAYFVIRIYDININREKSPKKPCIINQFSNPYPQLFPTKISDPKEVKEKARPLIAIGSFNLKF